MDGDVVKIVSMGRSGAEAGVVRSARESGDDVEIVQNASDGIAKADAVLLVCDSASDGQFGDVIGLCGERGIPWDLCELKFAHDDLVWLPLLETGQQLDALAGQAHKSELTLFVYGSRECDEPGIERKAKALFDRGFYCVKAHEEWLKGNGLGSKRILEADSIADATIADKSTFSTALRRAVADLPRLIGKLLFRLRYAGCFYEAKRSAAESAGVIEKVDQSMESFDQFPYHR